MGKTEKRLKAWLNNPPTEEGVDAVHAVLKRYFPGKFESKGGSHIVLRDERLAVFSGFEPYGELSIPIKGGRRVKRRYLQRLAQAVEIVTELEGTEDEES